MSATPSPVPSNPTPAQPPVRVVAPPPPSAPTVVAPPPRDGALNDLTSATRDKIRAAYWRVDEAAKVVGDVDVVQGDVRGVVSIGGRLTALQFQTVGRLEVTGEVAVNDRLTVFGSLRTSGPLRVGELSVEGTVTAGGSISVGGDVRWKGLLEGPADLSARTIRFEGGCRFGGNVGATEIRGELTVSSSSGSIRAESIVLRRRRRILGPKTTFSVDRIEGRVVVLEGVDCEYVRADRVIVGRDCHLTRVDGRIVRQHPSAHVGPESRSPRPHGITR